MDFNNPTLPVIDYRAPSTSDEPPPTPEARRRRNVVRAMAVAWWFGVMLSGVGSDHVRLPVVKKVAFTVAAVIICGLLCAGPGRYRVGVAGTFLVLAAWVLLIAWAWN